jgi:heme exporter protein C
VEKLKHFTRFLLLAGMAVGTVLTFVAPPAASFPNPDLARLVFWHLPCALLSPIFLLIPAPWFAFKYLKTKELHWDIRSEAAAEVGVLLGLLTLGTGMIFARVQWGAWWNWDPRQTSFLLAMLIAFAYFAIRGAFSDPEKRGSNSAAYLLAALLPLLFLVFVYPKLPAVLSLHPNVLRDGGFDSTYRGVFLTMFALLGVVSAALYNLRVRAGLLELQFENQNAKLADRGARAATGVVRPVSLPPDGGASS